MEADWLTVKEAMAFEGISRRECYNRMRPGDSHFLLSKARDDGPGRLIDARSMSFYGRQRWREHALASVAPAAESPAETGQLSLLPRTEIDNKIAALWLPNSMRDVVIRRYRIVDQCLNHNWKAQGHPSKRAFLKSLAAINQTSVRSIQRWATLYSRSGTLLSLADDDPGPEPYTGSVLDADMKAHLQGCWVLEKLTVRQCYKSLVRYLEGKQSSPGCRVSHIYKIPSYPTVARFVKSLDPLDHAAREGPETLKASCGYIDRTYTDLKSLERVETDEWKLDFYAYDAQRPKVVQRWWLLTFYDERSMFPLVGKLVAGSEYDLKHGIREEDEIEILVELLKGYGVPKAIYSDHGRFRGKTFGGHARKFETFDGILDRLGIGKAEPREKNPRGSRLERFHRFLADCSRTVPGWIGANDKERQMTPGDAQKELHEKWAKGDTSVPDTPLLSTAEAMQRIEQWMNDWRDHESKGTDMSGLSPRAVFARNTPQGGFNRLTDGQIALATAEHFKERIECGGVVQLRDGKRYSHPSLLLIQGEKREVVRLRQDHSQISVLPAAKGEEVIIATRRERVGANDPDNLARGMELQKRIRKAVGKFVNPLDYQVQVRVQPPMTMTSEELAREALGLENLAAAKPVKELDFADLEP